jgi:hypothetical protein
MIRGIGPVYARKMVRGFGEKVFEIIEATRIGCARWTAFRFYALAVCGKTLNLAMLALGAGVGSLSDSAGAESGKAAPSGLVVSAPALQSGTSLGMRTRL